MVDGYSFTKRSAKRIGNAVRTVEHTSRTTPANHRKYRSIVPNCGALMRLFVPGPYDYTPGPDVVAIVPAWTVEDVNGTPTVTGCTYQEVEECPAAAPLQTTYDTEADLVSAIDPTSYPTASLFYVVNDDDPDNLVSDLYIVQGPEGDLGTAFQRVGGMTPLEERQLAFWVANQ